MLWDVSFSHNTQRIKTPHSLTTFPGITVTTTESYTLSKDRPGHVC